MVAGVRVECLFGSDIYGTYKIGVDDEEFRTYSILMMNNTMSLPMNFANARPSTEADWMWATVYYKGERGTVVAYCADDYAAPMLRVLFADGRHAMLKISELGA